jgi:N-methylhydantoinase A/oxoprolinase/acetone carboxylase beta subunit
MGIDPLDAALAAVTIFNDNCRNHIIATVTGRGYGTEDFALMSWGSGGPLHIGSISEGLTFTDLLIPKWAPAFSAFGGTCADFSYRRDLTVNLDIPSKSSAETKLNIAKKINSAWSTLKAEVMEEFTSAGVSSKKVKFHPYVKMKYLGQLNDVEVGSPSEKIRNEDDIETIEKRFEELYARIYTRAARSPELGFSVTSVFVLGIVDTIKPELMHEQIESKEPSDDAYKKGREIYYGNKWLKADVFDLEKLKPGNEIKGTALLEGPFTTILTLPKRKILLDTHMIFHVHQGEIGSA